MKNLLIKIYTRGVFINSGRLLFASSRINKLELFSLSLARLFARLVVWTLGRNRQETPAALAAEWRRLMPRPQSDFPITHTDEKTAYVEIRIKCPLRGSGNALACWRSMEFDRAIMKGTGGHLVVTESQSVTGGDCCRLAIRRTEEHFDDLPVAHTNWRK